MSTGSSTGIGAGSVLLARWVRLSRPRVTSALVPSGKTSSSLAERRATGALAPTRTVTVGWPTTSNGSSTVQS